MRLDELFTLIRGPVRPTPDQLRYRRRRLSALGALAAIALVLGLVAGSGGGGEDQPRAVAVDGTPVGWYGHLATLAGAGEGSLDLEERAEEDQALTRALASTPFVRKGGAEKKLIALTFDDGPGPYTDRLLDVLDRLHAPATFFTLGREVDAYPEALQRLVDSGMPVANHTHGHPNLEQLSRAGQRAEIVDAAREIEAAGAPFPRLFRPPYGAYDRATHDILEQERMLSVLWSVDSEDYTKPGVAKIVRNVVENAHPGAIVLMHDGGGEREQTIAAVKRIVPALRRTGYRFVTVPRLLLEAPPVAADQGLPPGFNPSGAG